MNIHTTINIVFHGEIVLILSGMCQPSVSTPLGNKLRVLAALVQWAHLQLKQFRLIVVDIVNIKCWIYTAHTAKQCWQSKSNSYQIVISICVHISFNIFPFILICAPLSTKNQIVIYRQNIRRTSNGICTVHTQKKQQKLYTYEFVFITRR